MHDRVPTTYIPKITIKPQDSLYQLSYSEVHPSNNKYNEDQVSLPDFKAFNIYFYVDIPTIDYYIDELKDTKLSRFNRKFKLNLLKESIWRAFTNGNQEFWDTIRRGNKVCCSLNIRTSGSLRYVGTIKYLMESVYREFGSGNLKISLTVSDLTYKWFRTFLDRSLIEAGIVTFIRVKNVVFKAKFGERGNHYKDGSPPYSVENPFKEYFRRLHAKFTHHTNESRPATQLESIVIVTNSTGIKALLTILSDKPLTNFISEESINELYNYTVSFSNLGQDFSRSGSCESVVSSIEHNGTSTSSISRKSSSLLNFQNIALTSNKDRSVRIRSQSLTNRRVTNTRILNRSFSNGNNHIIGTNTTTTTTSSGHNSNDSTTENLEAWYERHGAIAERNLYESPIDEIDIDMDGNRDQDDEYEYDDDDESVTDSEYGKGGSDDGISFYVRSFLSRTPSMSNVANNDNFEEIPVAFPSTTQTTTMNTIANTDKKARVRSLSLMDPALKRPFVQTATSTPPTIITTNHSDNNNNNNNNSIPIYVTIPKEHSSKSYNNICIHDGDFNDPLSSRKTRKRKLSISRGNSLIPPELYSRISSPVVSNNSSSTSLPHLNNTPSIDIIMCDSDDGSPSIRNSYGDGNGSDSGSTGDSTLKVSSHSPLRFEKNLTKEPLQQHEHQGVNYFADFLTRLGGQQKSGIQRPFGLCFNNYDYEYLKSSTQRHRHSRVSDTQGLTASFGDLCEDDEIRDETFTSEANTDNNSMNRNRNRNRSRIESIAETNTTATTTGGIDSCEHSLSGDGSSDVSMTRHSEGNSSSSSVSSVVEDLGLSLHLDLYGNKDVHVPKSKTQLLSELGNDGTDGDNCQTTIGSPKVPFKKIPSLNLYGDDDFSAPFGAGEAASTRHPGRSAWVLGGNVL